MVPASGESAAVGPGMIVNDSDDPGEIVELNGRYRLGFKNPDPDWITTNRNNGLGYLNVNYDSKNRKNRLKWRVKVRHRL